MRVQNVAGADPDSASEGWRVPSDPSLFVPGELQARALMSHSLSAMWIWLGRNVAPLRTMVHEYHQNWVIVGSRIERLDPVSEADADELVFWVSRVQLRRAGSMLDLDVDVVAGARTVARVGILSIVVQFDDQSMAGAPGTLHGALQRGFAAHQLDPAPPTRRVPQLVAELEHGRPLGALEHGFRIHRHHCEVADMWCFVEVPTLAAEARETLAMDGDSKELRRLLTRPLALLELELRRPFYVLDRGRVHTAGFAGDDGSIGFVHRFVGPAGDEAVRGVVVEKFLP